MGQLNPIHLPMTPINQGRVVYFLVIFLAAILGFLLSGLSVGSWVPYVLLGMLCLSLGLLFTLLFVKNAGTTTSWPALIAMGVVLTLLFTGIFQRAKGATVPDEAQAVVEALQTYQEKNERYPKALDQLPLGDIPARLSYEPGAEGHSFVLRYRPEEGPLHTYRSEAQNWKQAEE
jgi:hypothetical protein